MTLTYEQSLQKYADIIVRIGLNLSSGQRLIVNAPVQSALLVQKVALSAYQAGCRYVDVIYQTSWSSWPVTSMRRVIHLRNTRLTCLRRSCSTLKMVAPTCASPVRIPTCSKPGF